MSILLTKEVIAFVRKILLATRQGTLAWETSADPDTLIAPLGADYSVLLTQVPDFVEEDRADPDHILTLVKGRKHLFSVDRRDFPDVYDFRLKFGDVVQGEDYFPFQMFKEIWVLASFKASKIREELEAVNSILDSQLGLE